MIPLDSKQPDCSDAVMALARKIILHSPVANTAALEPFVERCLRDGVSLIAVFGPGSAELEETIDWIVVGDGTDPERFLCTSSHPDEPYEDVVNMVECWELERNDAFEEIRL
jgi:hypothetical protein